MATSFEFQEWASLAQAAPEDFERQRREADPSFSRRVER
jgi:hypothetical protein